VFVLYKLSFSEKTPQIQTAARAVSILTYCKL